MKKLALIALLVLPSCGIVSAVEKVADKVNEIHAAYVVHAKAADKNEDGKTTVQEWVLYLLGLIGLGGAGGGALLARNAKSNARKDIIEREVSDLKAKVGK